MKKVFVLAAMLALSGCATPTDPTQISAKAKEIQGYTKIACSFVPTVGTIVNILAGGVAAPAVAIASDICQAVTTVPLADGGPRAAKVYGVAIKGSFVKK